MERLTLILGSLLILIGGGFFVGTGLTKYSALIPLPFGILFLLLGRLAMTEKWRKTAMHIASILGFIGAIPLLMGAPKLIAFIQGEALKRPLAVLEMSIMGSLCLLYFVLCVKYFIDRRLEKKRSY